MSGAFIGRETERRRLKIALDDPGTHVIAVQGHSGAGKTALVETVLSEARDSGAIVGRGKYADGSASGAFLPVLQALSEAVNNALELLYDPGAGATSLREAMRPQLALLASAGLNVADITPAELDPSLALAGRAGAARIVEAALRLLHWLKGFGVPVILFVDDWHRAPREAQTFVAAVSREHEGCTLLLAERYDTSPSRQMAESAIMRVALGPLDDDDREALLEAAAGKIGAGPAIAQWLSNSSSGLPFDLIQAASALNDQAALVKSGERWTVDSTRAALIDRADFSDAILRRIRQMPGDTLHTGAAVALWGDMAPLDLVCEALGESFDVTMANAELLKQAGVMAISDRVAHVLHDRLRAALLAAIEPGALVLLASQMSERMVQWPAERWNSVARTALYLRLTGGIEQVVPETWRDRFALGALAARNVADSAAATDFAEAAWRLRELAQPADADSERLILREAIFAAGLRRDRLALRERATLFIANSGSEEVRGQAYETAIQVARLIGESALAWQWVVEGFRSFRIHLPAKATLRHVAWAILRWRIALALRGRTGTKSIVGALDPLVRLSNIAAIIAFEGQPLQAMLIALKAATHARRHGYSDPVWVATDTFISASLNDQARAAQLGEIASRYAERSAFSPSVTLYRSLYFGEIWSKPLASLYPAGEKLYEWSIAEGDVVNAALTVRNDALLAWRVLPALDVLSERLAENERRSERLADERAIHAVREFMGFVSLLRDPAGLAAPLDFITDISRSMAGWGTPVAKLEMLALRGDWPQIVGFCSQLKGLRPQLNSHPGGVIWRFFETLARLRLGLVPIKGDVKFVQRAAKLNPVDHRGKLLLLEAEQARLKGDKGKAIERYALAVEFAAKCSSRLEEGLIAEFAAFGSRVLGDAEGAARYTARTTVVWRQWGAAAKLGAPIVPEVTASETATRLAEAESQAAVAARSERAKSRFLAEVAHELRTPLQGMQGLVELAADGTEKVDMKELRDVLGSLRNVVDDLTDLEALGAGAPLNLKPADFASLLETEASAFAALARKKGLAFETVIEEPARGYFLIDAPRLRQIVRNLLSNAIKYVDSGSVRLRVTAKPKSETSVAFSLAVEDTGPGLREEDLHRLFEPFERAGRDTADGIGLGLALSRRIAVRMNGQLTAENLKPRGARFELTFTAERTIAEPQQDVIDVPPLRLLVVEDVPLSRRILAAMLRRDGHDVREAGGGYEALDICNREAIDLVFLDLGLPDIDGIEVLQRIKDAGLKMPVVVLTASAVPAMKERAALAGAVMTLRKPATGAELRGALAEVLSRPTPLSDEQTEEFHSLRIEAQLEISAMAQEIVEHASSMDSTAIRIKAHRLAGLAAQFFATDVAESADRLEAAVIAGEELTPALTQVAVALTRFRTGI